MQGSCRGFSLIEAMVAALVLAVGLLGLAKLQAGLYQSARRDADRLHALNAAMRSYEQFASQALSRLAVDIPGQRRSHIAGTTYEIEQRLTRDGSLSRSRTRVRWAAAGEGELVIESQFAHTGDLRDVRWLTGQQAPP